MGPAIITLVLLAGAVMAVLFGAIDVAGWLN